MTRQEWAYREKIISYVYDKTTGLKRISQTSEELGIEPPIVGYHVNKRKHPNKQKEYYEAYKKRNGKLYYLKARINKFAGGPDIIKTEDVINKFGHNPVCYLSGLPISFDNPDSYSLDHKIPKSKGGQNTLENMGLTTKEINYAKHYLGLNQFIDLCKSVSSKQNEYRPISIHTY